MTAIPVPKPAVPGPAKAKAGQMISQLMQLLQKLPKEKATPEMYREVLRWVMDLPPTARPAALAPAIASAFGKSVEDIERELNPTAARNEFDLLVPRSGWFHDYIEWTAQTEAPTVFHFFIAATILGVSLGRKVHVDKGAYKVFPNLWTVIVAPTGKCRKTTACGIGTAMFQVNGGKVFADKTTPEALIDGMKEMQHAVGLVYAPELAVFLGKQKYQEGMIPLLTRLGDCPDEWRSETIGRGGSSLSNVALSQLMCSTIDWIATAIPKDAFGGGFMSRYIFIVQDATPRSFPRPPKLDATMKKDLTSRLLKLSTMNAEYRFSEQSGRWYDEWYNSRQQRHESKQYAGYFERKPDHVLRIAMLLTAAELGWAKPADKPENFILTEERLVHAERILQWVEMWLPSTFEEMTASAVGDDQARILRQLRSKGGQMQHSELLRRNTSKMNAEGFKRAMATLREAKLVDWDPVGKIYYLTSEGWDQ